MYNYFSKKIVNMLISRNYIPNESGEMYIGTLFTE